jgi:hypothetical protein
MPAPASSLKARAWEATGAGDHRGELRGKGDRLELAGLRHPQRRRVRQRKRPRPRTGISVSSRTKIPHDLMPKRYEQAATIVTSNLDFTAWDQAFPANRRLDRLRHNAYCMVLDGQSYPAPKMALATSTKPR